MERRKPLAQLIAEGRAELKSTPAFDDITEVTERLEKAVEDVQEMRGKMPSGTNIIVNPAPPVTVDKHDSTPAELKLAWKHRGLIVRGILKALPWIAGLLAGAAGEKALKALGLL